jgi:hypothetical protein
LIIFISKNASATCIFLWGLFDFLKFVSLLSNPKFVWGSTSILSFTGQWFPTNQQWWESFTGMNTISSSKGAHHIHILHCILLLCRE